jgi:hypothetical protein
MNKTKTQYSYEVHMWGTGKFLRTEWRDSESERDLAAKRARSNPDFRGYEIRLIQRTVPVEESAPSSPG